LKATLADKGQAANPFYCIHYCLLFYCLLFRGYDRRAQSSKSKVESWMAFGVIKTSHSCLPSASRMCRNSRSDTGISPGNYSPVFCLTAF